MTRIGRNDPCHCGSGKKYKRCHLAADEKREPAAREPSPPAASPPLADVAGITGLLQKLAKTGSAGDRAEFTQLLAETQPVLAYMERQEAIESAGAALEDHREEFAKLAQDEQAYSNRAQELFAEEPFTPLWFTAADIRQAFERVGQPAGLVADDHTVETLRAAILQLADESRRKKMAMALLMHLPDYVAAGRFLDAWLIQVCAHETTEAGGESNPFLFAMFSHGYDAWTAEQDTRNETFMRELGLDPARLHSMSLPEIDTWLEEQQADPAMRSRIEAFMETHPDQRAQATASLEAMERDSVKLLEREDAAALLLLPEEIEPWLPVLTERMASIMERLPKTSGDLPPDAAAAKTVVEEIWPLLGEMAESIFTPERRRQLIARLKAYRDERFAAGDKRIAGGALGAINSLEREDDPAQNYFLNALCFVSLRSYGRAAGTTHADDAAMSAPDAPA